MTLATSDQQIAAAIDAERLRQESTINLIPSENAVSAAVREACASHLMNKYSEGYSHKRYYQGNEHADTVEDFAIARAKQLFGAEHVNVQPLSGSPANQAVYLGLLKPGDTVLGLRLDCGGHLTHGSPVNFSGIIYHAVSYGVDAKTGRIDMAEVRKLALEHKPKLLISGITAYSRVVDFKAFQDVAAEVGAIHLADISHLAGLIVAGVHPSPFPHADVVMTTTHKTLRGPRGAIIMCKAQYAKAIDKAVFPGLQGGPHDNVTAAKAVALLEASTPAFRSYGKQVVENAQALAARLTERGVTLVTGGTDNHLLLIDLTPRGIGLGRPVAQSLEAAGIVLNANTIPYDPSTPFKPSGLRLGTPLMTTRGMRAHEMIMIADWIADIIESPDDEALQAKTKAAVASLCAAFPLP